MHPTYVVWMMWDCNLVHGWMVCTELALRRQHFTRHHSHATTKERYRHTTSLDVNKTRYRRYSHSFRITCDMWAVSLLESREQRYIKDIKIIIILIITFCLIFAFVWTCICMCMNLYLYLYELVFVWTLSLSPLFPVQFAFFCVFFILLFLFCFFVLYCWFNCQQTQAYIVIW